MKEYWPALGAAVIWGFWGWYKSKNPGAKVSPDMPTFRAIKNKFKKKT